MRSVSDSSRIKGWKALGYESFKAYGEKELGYQEAHIYRLVEAAEVSLQIGYSPLGESSPKETQLYQLADAAEISLQLGFSTLVENQPKETHLRPLKAVPEEERKAIWEEATRKADIAPHRIDARRLAPVKIQGASNITP